MKISSLQKGLVAHWTMSQDSLKGSLLADKTPYENDGTIYGVLSASKEPLRLSCDIVQWATNPLFKLDNFIMI